MGDKIAVDVIDGRHDSGGDEGRRYDRLRPHLGARYPCAIPVRGRTGNSDSLIGQIMSLVGRVGNFSGTA